MFYLLLRAQTADLGSLVAMATVLATYWRGCRCLSTC